MRRPLSYIIESRMVAGAWQGFVVAVCGGCDKKFEVKWKGRQNPYFIARHFHRIGWSFDAYRQASNKCPSCNTMLALPGRNLETVISKAPDLNKFCDRLKWTREQIHLSRDDLATKAGINRRLLEHLEDNTISERYDELHVSAGRKLAAVLIQHGAPIEANWLIGITEETNVLSLNLRRICDKKSMIEGQLALKSGVPLSVIQAIFSGALSSTNRVAELAKALDVDVEVLTGGGRLPLALAQRSVNAPTPSHEAAILIVKGSESKPFPPPPWVKIEASSIPDTSIEEQRREAGSGLRAARLARNLSQAQLVELINRYDHGFSWSAATFKTIISQIECGYKTIRAADQVFALAAHAFRDFDEDRDWPRSAQSPSSDSPSLDEGQVPSETQQNSAYNTETRDLFAPSVTTSAWPLRGQSPPSAEAQELTGLPVTLASLHDEIRRAENDIAGLRAILADLEPVQHMVQEMAGKIAVIKELVTFAFVSPKLIEGQEDCATHSLLDEAEALPQSDQSRPSGEALIMQSPNPQPDDRELISERIRAEYGDHLRLIGGTWFYRRRVPPRAQEAFGVSEIRRSLQTNKLSEARKLKIPLEQAFEEKLSEVEKSKGKS